MDWRDYVFFFCITVLFGFMSWCKGLDRGKSEAICDKRHSDIGMYTMLRVHCPDAEIPVAQGMQECIALVYVLNGEQRLFYAPTNYSSPFIREFEQAKEGE